MKPLTAQEPDTFCETCGVWRKPNDCCAACGLEAVEVQAHGLCDLPPTDEVPVPDESGAWR